MQACHRVIPALGEHALAVYCKSSTTAKEFPFTIGALCGHVRLVSRKNLILQVAARILPDIFNTLRKSSRPRCLGVTSACAKRTKIEDHSTQQVRIAI